MKQGWSLNQLDDSDIFFLFDLFTDDKVQEDKLVYADQVPWL
jgi:hypothetical protein